MSIFQLRANDLVDLDTMKDYLGFCPTRQEENILTLMIKSATDFIEGQLTGVDQMQGGYCNRRFIATTYTSALYSGAGFKNLLVRQFPINSITTIIIDDTTKYPSGSSSLAELGFYVDYEMLGNLINTNVWTSGDPQNIALTYNAGYSSIPFDLQLAVAALVAMKWNQKGNEAYKSEKIGNYSYTIKDLAADNPFGDGVIKDTFDKYRKLEL